MQVATGNGIRTKDKKYVHGKFSELTENIIKKSSRN